MLFCAVEETWPDLPETLQLPLNAPQSVTLLCACAQAYLLIEEDIQDLSRSDEYKWVWCNLLPQ